MTAAHLSAGAHVSVAQLAAQSCMIAMTAGLILALMRLGMLGHHTIVRRR